MLYDQSRTYVDLTSAGQEEISWLLTRFSCPSGGRPALMIDCLDVASSADSVTA